MCALYVGDTVAEVFATTFSGETFTRIASYIGDVATIFNPTFTDLGDGNYRYSYVPTVIGAHQWIGAGDASGGLVINFDVDTNPPSVTTVVLTSIPILGAIDGARVGLQDLVIPQATGSSFVFHWFAGDDLIDSAGYLARLTIRQDYGGATLLHLSTGTGHIEVGFDPPKWAASTGYSVGQRVVPSSGLNGYVYEVISAGTTGASQPTWPTVLGQTVASGSVVFRAEDADTYVSNMRITLTPEDTEALDTFTNAVYDLIWEDNFDRQCRLMQGNATLAPNVSDPI